MGRFFKKFNLLIHLFIHSTNIGCCRLCWTEGRRRGESCALKEHSDFLLNQLPWSPLCAPSQHVGYFIEITDSTNTCWVFLLLVPLCWVRDYMVPAYPMGLLWGLRELIQVKCLALHLGPRRCLIDVWGIESVNLVPSGKLLLGKDW